MAKREMKVTLTMAFFTTHPAKAIKEAVKVGREHNKKTRGYAFCRHSYTVEKAKPARGGGVRW